VEKWKKRKKSRRQKKIVENENNARSFLPYIKCIHIFFTLITITILPPSTNSSSHTRKRHIKWAKGASKVQFACVCVCVLVQNHFNYFSTNSFFIYLFYAHTTFHIIIRHRIIINFFMHCVRTIFCCVHNN
jgi:hypothetical protein